MTDAPRIVFMGTPDFAVPSLNALVDAGLTPVAVVTVPDKPAGRGRKVRESAVKQAADRHGIPVLQPESLKEEAFRQRLIELEPDIHAVVAFRILPQAVFETARLGAFNLHGSLLPAYRGAAPINRALMDGVTETGVTTFFLRPSVDTGDVILWRRTPVGPDETAGDVHDRLMEIGAEAVVETVRRIASGDAEGHPQDDALASPAPKIFREHAEIDWSHPAPEVHNHIRALSPYPGAWTTWDPGTGPETLKILRTRVWPPEAQPSEASGGTDAAPASGEPGEILGASGPLVVACETGAVDVLEVQREGKRRMSVADFLNGANLARGARFGTAEA